MAFKNHLSEYIHAMTQSSTLAGKVAFHHVFPMTQPVYSDLNPSLSKNVKKLLNSLGIQNLFNHQASAIDWLRKGHHTVVSTPTASGK